ncbi:unnamed protein product [Porites lobata]|uniref:C3H1-type domain-containing protein n=1 Tax=Porites lobata TaxID=104759 RepID=A0ABN8S8S4_9CNID|nr:unnamed protein product [Porites lobata]
MVLCAAHPHHWPDLSKYKLLIIQTARHFSSSAWLEYDLAFRKDAAASGLSDWSRMNLDLYNFHLRSPAMASPPPPWSSSSTASSPLPAALRDTSVVPPFCHSWNDGQCRWPFGRCKYRHRCSNCEGEHTQINSLPHRCSRRLMGFSVGLSAGRVPGLAPSTRRVYLSAQRRYIDFLPPGWSPLTAMAPSLLPMRRLSCALLHSWPTT